MPDADARTQFRLAINGRNVALAERAARREPLALDQVLEFVILLAEKADERYDRAAARLVARLAVERALTLPEHAQVVRVVEQLPIDPESARTALLPLCRRR